MKSLARGKADWSNLIHFIEDGADTSEGFGCCSVGSRVPSINIDQRNRPKFEFAMGLGKDDFVNRDFKIKKGKWYEILITQRLEDGKV